MSKEIKDLTDIEIVEDIDYYLRQAQIQSPPFVDYIFDVIRKYVKELHKRMGG